MDRQSRALVLTTGRGIAFEKRAMSRRAADDDEVEVVVVEEEVEDDGTELILPGGAAALLSADASASHTACADRRFRVGLFVGLFVVVFFLVFLPNDVDLGFGLSTEPSPALTGGFRRKKNKQNKMKGHLKKNHR